MSSLFRLFKGDSRGEISGPFFFFLVQSRIAVYALNRTRRVGLSALHIAENKIRGSFHLKGYGTDSMTSRELKSHRNEHAVRGRSIRKEVEHFWNGSAACPSRDQFTSEHLWVKKKRIMLYQMSYQILILINASSEASSYFLDVIVHQVLGIPVRTLQRLILTSNYAMLKENE